MKPALVFSLTAIVATMGCSKESISTASNSSADTNTQESATTQTKAPESLPKPAAATNAPAASSSISIQEMLVSGPTQLKLHSLAMITQGNVKGEIDESYLPGLKACAEDEALPLRSVAAQVLGKYFVREKEKPNAEAVELLVKLTKDESADVRFSAVYHGLCQIEKKSDDMLNLLIDFAASNRQQSLYDRIAESLSNDRDRVTKILDQRLEQGDDIAVYEIYEDLTGKKPADADKYLEMPTSRPRLFLFSVEGSDAEALKNELAKALAEAGIENPNVNISGTDANRILLLKTYIAKEHLIVEEKFANHPNFKLIQDMWVTPEIEIQIEAMQKK